MENPRGTAVGLWRFLRDGVANPLCLWFAFVLAHLWLGMLNLYADGYPLGDVTFVYKFWTDQILVGHFWVGIDSPWVYPIVAILPMLAAAAFGPALYASTWLSMVMLLNAVALAAITGWGRKPRNVAVGWWWVGFLVLLGPISLGRIDSITVPIAIVGVMLLTAHPRAAAIVLTVATWIKVWPAAILAAMVIAARTRLRIFAAAVGTSVLIAGLALSFGSGANVLSFITQQTSRGLQVEAPVSTIWLWEAFAGVPSAYPYYDQALLTWQVAGGGVEVANALMTVLMVLAAASIALLAIRIVGRGVPAAEVLPPLALALVMSLIAFNKVGSPQFMTWLAVPVILGLATRAAGRGRSFRVPAAMAMVLAVLTQAFYPYLYGLLLGLNPGMLIILTARNVLVFVLLGWAVLALWRVGADRGVAPGTVTAASTEDFRQASGVWPFASRDGFGHDGLGRDRLGADEPLN